MKNFIKKLLKEEYRKVSLLEELSLIIENEITVGPELTTKLKRANRPETNKLLTFLNSNEISDKTDIESVEYSKGDGQPLTAYKTDRNGKVRGVEWKLGKLLTNLGGMGKFQSHELETILSYIKKAKKEELENLKVVDGEKILWAYHCENYEKGGYDETMGSCMRYEEAQNYLGIYTSNPNEVKCLVLINPESGKIKARALLWNTDSGKKYMDRIYFTSKEYIKIFNTYADNNGYVMESNDTITLTNGGEYKQYPYMDNFIYYTPNENMLSVDEISFESLLLHDQEGGSEGGGKYIDYGEYEGETVSKDDAKEIIYSTINDYGDVVDYNGYAHVDDLEEVEGEYFFEEDLVELYDGEKGFKYGDGIRKLTHGDYKGKYFDFRWDESVDRLDPEHYGKDAYATGDVRELDKSYNKKGVNKTYALGEHVVELYTGYYAYDKDIKPLIDTHYATNDNKTAYAMTNETVPLYPDFYDNDVYALDDDVVKINLPHDGEYWVLKADAEDFEEYIVYDDNTEHIGTDVEDFEDHDEDDGEIDYLNKSASYDYDTISESRKKTIKTLLRENITKK